MFNLSKGVNGAICLFLLLWWSIGAGVLTFKVQHNRGIAPYL